MNDSPVERPVFRELCKRAGDKSLHVEISVGGQRRENRDDKPDPSVAGRVLGKVFVTRAGKNNVLVERTILNDDIEEAAAGCLAFLDGVVP